MSNVYISDTLPRNILVERLGRQIIADLEQGLPCDCCSYEGSHSLAKFRCINCKDYLCEDCNLIHKKTRLTRSHTIIEVRARLWDGGRSCRCNECDTHRMMTLSYFDGPGTRKYSWAGLHFIFISFDMCNTKQRATLIKYFTRKPEVRSLFSKILAKASCSADRKSVV